MTIEAAEEEQDYSQKETNMNTQNSGITRRSFAKTWRRKPDCKQTESADTKQSKYLSMIEHLQEKNIANKEYSEHDST